MLKLYNYEWIYKLLLKFNDIELLQGPNFIVGCLTNINYKTNNMYGRDLFKYSNEVLHGLMTLAMQLNHQLMDPTISELIHI
jgi:hypothetical protein